MKKFEIPDFYRSSIISKVKAQRKLEDPRKKDFTPTLLDFGKIRFLIARHFGFCYGVENAIEISYKAIHENPTKRIFLLSQMIHNPDVNADLLSHGTILVHDASRQHLIPWEDLNSDHIVIIPAFGTTVEIEKKLTDIGVNVAKYNTTCPFVEKVWNRSETLGSKNHTIVIHGKHSHEETRATFSRSNQNAQAIVIKDLNEAKLLAKVILGDSSSADFYAQFKGKHSENFNPEMDLKKIGVINQTTMLASETQEITEYLRSVMSEKYGEESLTDHIADTRDTLCYATNDNQSATLGLLEETADLAIVVGGYNSSNTTHLVELLEQKFTTFFIQSEASIADVDTISSFDIHSKTVMTLDSFLPKNEAVTTIIITSGASCPDSIVEGVIQKVLKISGNS